MRALVAGWFSFEQMGATAGDLVSRDLARQWLESAGIGCDVATAPPFQGGVDWQVVDPGLYDVVVFVCGPFGNGWPVTPFLDRFAGRRLIGLNLSMLETLETWNPFDVLFERDSSRASRPDIAFLAGPSVVPLVGVLLVHPQPEYGHRGLHEAANRAVDRLLASREVARLPIDTRLDENATGLRTAGEVESAIAHVDAVVTTRLHGLVFAIRNGVPALAIDPVDGGAKVAAQARAIDWPAVFTADSIVGEDRDAALREALEFCLSDAGRAAAGAARTRAETYLASLPGDVVEAAFGTGRKRDA